MTTQPKVPRLNSELWKRYTEWPLLAIAVLFLIVYSIQVINNLTDEQGQIINLIIWITWGLFAIDYIAQLMLAEKRGAWFLKNLHQLLILALPVLRPLRLLRLVSLLRLMQLVALKAVQGRIVTYVIGAASLLTYVGALAVLDAEQNVSESNIKNFGDAIWWAVTTITTVGYGDYYPVTLVGRLVAFGLMIGGIAVLGVVTATLASWLVEQIRTPAVENNLDKNSDSFLKNQ